MPKICQNCNKQFSMSVIINGKRRNLGNRKFCLQCSPWGKHNTSKNIGINAHENKTQKFCSMCKQTKDIQQFYNKRDRKGKCVYCVQCLNRQTADRFRLFKNKCVQYKGGKCQCCGYNKYEGALQFHHIDPSKKDFNISQVKKRAFNQIITDQLDKCIMLCSNCHREEHARLKGLL